MLGNQVSHYHIIERLGSGGMGDVYRARDTRLDRDVALKFLAAPLKRDTSARERFAAEAKALSTLDHPNICAIYDIDDTDDGGQFIAMAYCSGHTLEESLRSGPLSLDEVTRIGAQVAGGLAAAHERGVVHRDIKPANVIIDDDGRAKIIDFGVASMAGPHLTKTGASVGTGGYMAPEQIRGEAVDARTDVWGLGVLLYEMLSGRKPFEAPYDQAVSYRILNEEPDPLDEDLEEASGELEDLVYACLEKDPAARPASMKEISCSLQAMLPPLEDTASHQRWPRRKLRRALRTRRGRLAGVAAVAIMLVFLVAGLLSDSAGPVPTEKYLVVLPLSPAGTTAEDQLFSEGLTAALTNKLAQLASYTDDPYWVVPHTEVRVRSVTSPSAARRVFGATLAIEGSAAKTPSGLRLNLGLVDTGTLKTLRALDLDVPREHINRLESEAARGVAEMMRMEVRPEFRLALEVGRTGNADAYDLYLEGKAHLQRYELKDNLDAATGLLQRSVTLDPHFAGAFAALGEAHWRLYEMTKDEIHIALATRNLEQALAIDEQLAEAHVTLSQLYASTDRAGKALDAINRAIDLEPGNADALIALGNIYDRDGREEEAEHAIKQAIAMQPAYWAGYNALGTFYYRRGRYEEAETQFSRVVVLTPDNVRGHSNLGAVYFHMERFEDAAACFETSVALEPTIAAYSNLASLYFFIGEMESALMTYRKALEIQDGDYRLWLNMSSAHSASGQEEEAQAALRNAIRLAKRQLQLNPSDQRTRVDLAGALASIGENDQAFHQLRSFDGEDITDVENFFQIGATYEAIGERERALDWLCKAVGAGYSAVPLQRTPELASLREDPAFSRIASCAPGG